MTDIIESNRASALLAKLGRGSLDADFARAVTRVCQAVAETQGKGEVVLKIKVEMNKDTDSGGICMTPSVSEKAPKPGLPRTTMMLQDDGTLLTQQEWLFSGPDERSMQTVAPLDEPARKRTNIQPLADKPARPPMVGDAAGLHNETDEE